MPKKGIRSRRRRRINKKSHVRVLYLCATDESADRNPLVLQWAVDMFTKPDDTIQYFLGSQLTHNLAIRRCGANIEAADLSERCRYRNLTFDIVVSEYCPIASRAISIFRHPQTLMNLVNLTSIGSLLLVPRVFCVTSQWVDYIKTDMLPSIGFQHSFDLGSEVSVFERTK